MEPGAGLTAADGSLLGWTVCVTCVSNLTGRSRGNSRQPSEPWVPSSCCSHETRHRRNTAPQASAPTEQGSAALKDQQLPGCVCGCFQCICLVLMGCFAVLTGIILI